MNIDVLKSRLESIDSIRESSMFKHLSDLIIAALSSLSDDDQQVLYDSILCSCFRVLHQEDN